MNERDRHDDPAMQPDVAAAWAEEINRRIAAFDRGDVKAADAATSLAMLRQKLAEYRTARGR